MSASDDKIIAQLADNNSQQKEIIEAQHATLAMFETQLKLITDQLAAMESRNALLLTLFFFKVKPLPFFKKGFTFCCFFKKRVKKGKKRVYLLLFFKKGKKRARKRTFKSKKS